MYVRTYARTYVQYIYVCTKYTVLESTATADPCPSSPTLILLHRKSLHKLLIDNQIRKQVCFL